MEPQVALTDSLIVGTYEWDSINFQNQAWMLIYPGLKELSDELHGSWSPFEVRSMMLAKRHWVFIGYENDGGVTQENWQPAWAHKFPRTAGYMGFIVVEPYVQKWNGHMFAHVFAAWVAPKYRGMKIFQVVLPWLEEQMKALKHTGMTFATHPNIANALKEIGYIPLTMNCQKVF